MHNILGRDNDIGCTMFWFVTGCLTGFIIFLWVGLRRFPSCTLSCVVNILSVASFCTSKRCILFAAKWDKHFAVVMLLWSQVWNSNKFHQIEKGLYSFGNHVPQVPVSCVCSGGSIKNKPFYEFIPLQVKGEVLEVFSLMTLINPTRILYLVLLRWVFF